MRTWYKKPITKAVLILLALLMPVAMALNLVVLVGYSGGALSLTGDSLFRSAGAYEETDTFEDLLQGAAYDVMQQIALKSEFETDGKYNPDKLVDIVDYYKTGKISGENISGLAYTLDELEEWGEDYTRGDSGYEEGNIVVCQKSDGTYHYYYMNEFEALIEDGGLKIEVEDADKERFLEELQEGYYSSGYANTNAVLKDEEGKTVYTDCWTFDEVVKEKFAPEGASGILEIVNDTPELNGKLSSVYEYLTYALYSISEGMNIYNSGADTWTEGNTNLTYLFVDKTAKKIYTNNSVFQNYENVDANLKALKEDPQNKYVIVNPKLKDFETNLDMTARTWKDLVETQDVLGDDYVAVIAVDTTYPIQDVFYTSAQNYDQYAPYLRGAGAFLILSSLLFLAALVWLTLVAGRTAGDEELHLLTFDRMKTELAAAAVIIPWLLVTWLVSSTWSGFGYTTTYYGSEAFYEVYHMSVYYTFSITATDVFVVVFYVVTTAALFLAGYLSLVRRIKAGTLWKNSVLRILCRWIGACAAFVREAWRNRNVTFRAAAAFAGVVLIHWIAFLTGGYPLFLVLMLAVEAAAAYYLIKNAIAKDRIKNGIREIASGNVHYQIPLEKMSGSSREMAEMVNDIGNGLQRAVAESMKSERLKTDLITNVSHDIKTPLTSIINYVDLLKRENFDDPKIQGYLDILEAKAQRLKTLTEDVVEASKVSSGNITLEYMDVDLVEMLNQTIGEFSEKMEAKHLQVIASLPEDAAVIHVDGRRMWRVLENIFNNAAKYAMPGTRVYADLKVADKKVEFSLKNISEQPLNINADELTERFIRGDVSRSTEGSGLGLSIAKSLTEMQGGKFSLYLDGDLFKVQIEFPAVF